MTKAHWQTPLKGFGKPSAHVLLWQGEKQVARSKAGRVMKRLPGLRRAWLLQTSDTRVAVSSPRSWSGPIGLAELLDDWAPAKGEQTVWLVRGWSDLVLTGLADLIDGNVFTWRYALLDGARCLFRGRLDGRSCVVTSLPCWTGGRWDAWPECVTSDPGKDTLRGMDKALPKDHVWDESGERLALATLVTILGSAYIFHCGAPKPTVAGQAKQLWRAWLGQRVWGSVDGPLSQNATADGTKRRYVAPLPNRPDACANAERHVCYGLPREQFYEGRFEGPLHVVDLSSAYLTALLLTPQPIAYRTCLKSPSLTVLAEHLGDGTGLALVRLQTTDHPYPVRRRGVPGRAVGHFWTWLAADELANSIIDGHCQEVHTAWIWSAKQRDRDAIGNVLSLRPSLRRKKAHGLACAWRALYCSLVGQFAAWARQWEDVQYPHSFGRWSAWSAADPTTGEEVRYRSIAGHTQRLQTRRTAHGAVPLMFGCVTSELRLTLANAMRAAGAGQTAALMADALWVTDAGLKRLKRHAREHLDGAWEIQVKASYDRAWLSGTGRAVVERDGRRYAQLSGVPHDLPADPSGRVRWERHEEWLQNDQPSAAHGVKVQTVSLDTTRMVRDHDFPCRPHVPWLVLRDAALVEELLVPRQPRKAALDEDE